MQSFQQKLPQNKGVHILSSYTVSSPHSFPKTVSGVKLMLIKWLIWTNIFIVAIKVFGNPFKGFKETKKLKKVRDQYRSENPAVKYAYAASKYFVNYNTPGWPSKAFNKYITHVLNKSQPAGRSSLHTLVFAITKKCGFKCEHCCEWDNLNKPEVLSREELLSIIIRFQQLGVSQIQLSGGEPLNRLHDILFVLDNALPQTDFWLYTTGYQLTKGTATLLKTHGLKGITISLDHCEEELHDQFRGKKGSYIRALQAAQYASQAGLAVCLSLCATKKFISIENLLQYANLARNVGACFIQILEPKPVGHYAGQDVILNTHHHKILERFFETVNYDKTYSSYPIITYHGYYSRRIGCSGSAKDYLYVDTDGDVHNCPFCQKKLFPAMHKSFRNFIAEMKMKGCGMYSTWSATQ